MATASSIRQETPRWKGLVQIQALSREQYARMLRAGVLRKDDPVQWTEGYLVGKPVGEGFAWPFTTIPADVPRLYETLPLWPLSVSQYQHLMTAGVLAEGAPIELLEGFLVAKDQGGGPGMGQSPLHAMIVAQILDLVKAVLGDRWVVRCQLPIALGPAASGMAGSEPEPDLTIVLGPQRRYADHHPGPTEILLVIEIADTSLRVDRLGKAALYAAAGIGLYWIVNLVDRRVEIFAEPDTAAGVYLRQESRTEAEVVSLTSEGLAVSLPVKDLLP
jgi:Uma2 family endonuclease